MPRKVENVTNQDFKRQISVSDTLLLLERNKILQIQLISFLYPFLGLFLAS